MDFAQIHDRLTQLKYAAADDDERVLPTDPESVAYLSRLMQVILDGRTIVYSYNAALLCVLVAFAVAHRYESRNIRTKWDETSSSLSSLQDTPLHVKSPRPPTGPRCHRRPLDGGRDGSTASSSSCTPQRVGSPPDLAKEADADLERLPLLGRPAQKPRPSSWSRAIAKTAAWLAYQPRPIPIVNRALPTNGTSCTVLAWLALNVFVHFYQLPLEAKYFFAFADRSGLIFAANLPLLYLLAAKNQPIKLLTGRSYEALNIFHRRVGEFMCFQAVVHLVSVSLWFGPIAPPYLAVQDWWRYWTHPLILAGVGAFVPYELLYFTSLGSFRQRWYELFLASHIILQIVALASLYLHYHTAQPFVAVSLAIFIADRIAWRLGLKTATMEAHVEILEDGETLFLSAGWEIAASFARASLRPSSITSGWRPTDHVFLTVPSLGRTHALQAHPFTIASAAPPAESWTASTIPGKPTQARLCLLIRTHGGFTADLLAHARLNSRVAVRLDGPYGSSHALSLLRASDTAILVAGGSGIAVLYPLAAALLLQDAQDRPAGRRQAVHLLWVTHSRSHRSWVPEAWLDELVAAGMDLVIPEPTADAGRPDIQGSVDAWAMESAARGHAVGVVVSGPDGMNRTVRNVCARAIGEGMGVKIAVEKFGW